MVIEVELVCNLVYKVVWLKDNDKFFGKEVVMVKLFVLEVVSCIVN